MNRHVRVIIEEYPDVKNAVLICISDGESTAEAVIDIEDLGNAAADALVRHKSVDLHVANHRLPETRR